MAYDEALATRIREQLKGRSGVTEQRMFGGLAFLINGNMAVAASGQGGVLVRADPDTGLRELSSLGAEPMVMRGRPMDGWLRVDAGKVGTAKQLERCVNHGVGFASSLPPKR
ncbi:MAG: TfoX/Sxy family protein [Candidatus Dormibacteraeota bacterium]|nr:TfoX/Sxy family protein [Candidatus Dormibacteraeota bacterium]